MKGDMKNGLYLDELGYILHIKKPLFYLVGYKAQWWGCSTDDSGDEVMGRERAEALILPEEYLL